MDVFQAINHDATQLLQALVAAHRRDRVALHQHVALCQELKCLDHRAQAPALAWADLSAYAPLLERAHTPGRTDLEGVAIGSNEALAAFHKAFLVADNVANFDDVARDVVVEHLDGLWEGKERGEMGVESCGQYQRRTPGFVSASTSQASTGRLAPPVAARGGLPPQASPPPPPDAVSRQVVCVPVGTERCAPEA